MEKEYLGKPKGINQCLWIKKSAIADYDDGTKKGRYGLMKYYENQIKRNYIGGNDAVYPKKLMLYHKSVVKELKRVGEL